MTAEQLLVRLEDDLRGRVDHPVRAVRTGASGARLELLGRPSALAAVQQVLVGHGLSPVAGAWLRFAEGGVVAVRLVDPTAWGLPHAAVDALLGDTPRLAALDPVALLLVSAQRLAALEGVAPEAPSPALRAATQEERSWRAAKEQLRAWGMPRALELLQRWLHGGLLLPHDTCVAAQELQTSRGAAYAAVVRDAARPRSRPGGAVVALSGLDGAGKSSQAVALRETLLVLGVDAVVEWSRLAVDPRLDAVSRPVKAVLRRVARGAAPPSGAPPSTEVAAASRLREQVGIVGATWALVVAVVNLLAQRRTTQPHLRAGRVVVRDRYVLDSVVQLRYSYGRGRRLPMQTAVLRRLSTPTAASFLFELDGATAHARKPEEWSVEQLQDQAALYRAAADELRVTRLDGTAAREAISAQVARAVWSALIS